MLFDLPSLQPNKETAWESMNGTSFYYHTWNLPERFEYPRKYSFIMWSHLF